MKIIVSATAELAALAAAEQIVDIVRTAPTGILGLATGSSPQPLYRALASHVASGVVNMSNLRAFALDEYVGLDPAHPQSYHSVIRRDVVIPLRMQQARVHVPDGAAADVDAAAADYDTAISRSGGVDVQILGIGANGHIGFNEPGSSPASRTRRVDLARETIRANARFFDTAREVPRQAVSQGIGTILEARSIVLMATGLAKADAVRAAVEAPETASCPASSLQGHPDVTLYLDRMAASRLTQ